MEPAPAPSCQLLADVGVGTGASCVAWCPVNGLIAVGARPRPDLACVHIMSVHCPSRKVALSVPLAGPDDDIAGVAWSPSGCRRVLLAATRSGRLSAWTQQPPEPSAGPHHIALEDWWCHGVADLGGDAGAPAEPEGAGGGGGGGGPGARPQVVCVRWLQPPPTWSCGPAVLRQADFRAGSIPEMFAAPEQQKQQQQQQAAGGAADGAERADSAGGEPPADPFHWVRQGTLALAAVLSSGELSLSWAHWSAYGQLQWASTGRMPLPATHAAGDAAAGDVCVADAAACPGGVAVCYATRGAQATIHVAHVQGSPVHAAWGLLDASERVALPVVAAAAHDVASPAGAAVTALCWDHSSQGARLASAAAPAAPAGQGADGGVLTLHSWRPGGGLLQEGQAECPAAPRQQQLAWLLDGLVAWSGGQQLRLFQLEPLLQALPVDFPASSGEQRQAAAAGGGGRAGACPPTLQALAPSPHGVALAALLQCPPRSGGGAGAAARSRLLLYGVPAAPGAAPPDPKATAAARLLWALQANQHSWDAVQHALGAACQAAAGSAGPPGEAQAQFVGEVLSLVDAKVAAQQPTLKSTYSTRWDALKLAVLAATPGDAARVLSIDLRLRLLSAALKPVFDAVREDPALRSREQRVRLPGLSPLRGYLSSLLSFELACLRTWVSRRIAGAPGSAQLVPCIRHFLDFRSCNLLLLLHVVVSSAAAPPPGFKDDLAYPALKAALKAAPGGAKEPSWDAAVQALFPGPFQLHYSDTVPEALPSMNLPPEQLLRHMEASGGPGWAAQVPLSDADITAAATRLGLLPARPPKAIASYRQELRLHSGFRRPAPAPPATAAAEAGGPAGAQPPPAPPAPAASSTKRRRWERQLAEALGDMLGAGGYAGPGSSMDLAHLVTLEPGVPGLLQSVDGALLAREAAAVSALVSGDDASRALPRVVADHVAHSWVYACPITREMWTRGAGG